MDLAVRTTWVRKRAAWALERGISQRGCRQRLWERRRAAGYIAEQEALPPSSPLALSPPRNQSTGGRTMHQALGRRRLTPPIGHKTGRSPKWPQKDSGRGSGSPLMRAFAGSKPILTDFLSCLWTLY